MLTLPEWIGKLTQTLGSSIKCYQYAETVMQPLAHSPSVTRVLEFEQYMLHVCFLQHLQAVMTAFPLQ